MSFINANTANPNNSSVIGYQETTTIGPFINLNNNLLLTANNPLTTGVWLINVSLYIASANTNNINNVALNILYDTITLNPNTSTYAPESAVLYSQTTTFQQVALNNMTVLYVGNTNYYYGVFVSVTTTNGGLWNVLNSSPQQTSILRATKIA